MRAAWRLPAVILIVIVLVISTFPVSVLADGPAGGYDQNDFKRIGVNGLGDPMNNYAWSMAEFNGDLYAGTARNVLYYVGVWFKQLGLIPPDFELPISHPEGDLLTQQWAQNMGGDIWRYHHSKWTRVYRSGVTEFAAGKWIPDEPGFRSMIVFTDKWGENALYAAVGEGGTLPRHLLLKSTNGTSWSQVATTLDMGSDSRSLAVHNGKLCIAAKGATIWATDDPKTSGTGDNWEKVADFAAVGPGTNVAVLTMESLNGYLYAGTQNDSGFQVFRSNDRVPDDPQAGDWTQIVYSGAGDMSNTRALTMEVFKNSVYVGSACFPLTSDKPPGVRGPKGFEVIRINPDDSWELLVGDSDAWLPPGAPVSRVPESGWPGGFGNIMNYYCWSMQEKDGILYLGTFDTSSFLKAISLDEIIEFLEWSDLTPDEQEQMRQQLIRVVQQAIGPLKEINASANYEALLIILQTMPYNDWQAVWTYLLNGYAGADLWKTADGINWAPVTLNGFNDPYNYGIRTMINGSLYIGTANPFEGFQVLKAQYTPPAQVVGGEVQPAGKIKLMIPWAVLALLLTAWGVLSGLSRRRAR
jgi:hypothetical protein